MNNVQLFKFYDMFGWMDFREYGKKIEEKIGEKTLLVSVWLKGMEEKKTSGT